ncbi:hypothetical protein C1H76_7097 [Elsinoe australis]|uniref:Uncharacterized protein n=1 Tax=Elsinoe australis TaxID=40998 RepID=A0A4U7AVH4_9PEZI|nr:hypothetical protein C1H76_7097 [Elsinoe australis]
MPRRIVYGIGFWVFLAGVALTIASMSLPNWISYTSPSSSDPVHISYGLHKRCSSLTHSCEPFPQDQDCRGNERSFCSLWRSVGFLMNFTVVLELAIFVGFMVVILGGRGKREGGWKMVAGLSAVITVCQVVAMAIVAYLNDHDVRFQIGWALDTSTVLCTLSWIVMGVNAAGLVLAAYTMEPEDDYEQIQ